MEERRRMEMERVVTIKGAGGVDQDNVSAVAHLAHVDDRYSHLLAVQTIVNSIEYLSVFFLLFMVVRSYNLIHNKMQKNV